MDENKKDTVEFENTPETSTEAAAETKAAAAKKEKKNGWWDKTVNRKFLVIALAVAVLLNTGLTAGLNALQSKNRFKNMPDMRGPGSEMFDDENMAPPGGGPNGSQNGDQNGGQDQQSSKASIGIVITENDGVIVAQVSGENAKKAGFQEGDKVVSVEGKEVSTSNDLISEVQSHEAGDTISVTVERDGQKVELKTELE